MQIIGQNICFRYLEKFVKG